MAQAGHRRRGGFGGWPRALPAAVLALAGGGALATALPPEVALALQRAKVPESALAVVVQEVGSGRSVLSRQAQDALNPASVAKLLTTMAALDRLGPAWTWSTPVWLQGSLKDGVLEGPLVIQGSGDPTLVMERLWLLLRRVQQLGVQEIRGDIVLDGGSFAAAGADPAEFDGAALRPYNVQPDALLLNFKSVTFTFVPDAAAGIARLLVAPPLAGVAVERSVALAPGPCGDWRGGLKAAFGADAVSFAGRYPAACGELAWPVAWPEPARYNARAVEGLWREMGGRLGGTVREGRAPLALPPSFEWRSPPLAEAVRDINKFSNNVMAQQLFYTLALARDPSRPASAEGGRAALRAWLTDTLGELPPEVVIDNGSGLSRQTRVSAQLLARLLLRAWDSEMLPDLLASLPIMGVDGTLRRGRATRGRAQLKTGSLRDVVAVAGYVLSDSGRRYVLVAIVNHDNAQGARPAIEALVDWTLRDAPPR